MKQYIRKIKKWIENKYRELFQTCKNCGEFLLENHICNIEPDRIPERIRKKRKEVNE